MREQAKLTKEKENQREGTLKRTIKCSYNSIGATEILGCERSHSRGTLGIVDVVQKEK